MAQKADLRQAIARANTTRQPEPVREMPPPREVDAEKNPHFRPSREGKSNVTGYFPKAVKKQLRSMAADIDTTIEDCLAEALNDFFAKYGKPEIVPRKTRQ